VEIYAARRLHVNSAESRLRAIRELTNGVSEALTSKQRHRRAGDTNGTGGTGPSAADAAARVGSRAGRLGLGRSAGRKLARS
jgi:hypothetical protein